MNLRDSLLESIKKQQNIMLELPLEVEEAIASIMDDIDSERINGKAPAKDCIMVISMRFHPRQKAIVIPY